MPLYEDDLDTSDAHTLFYDRPAAAWTEALPLGNGRQGVMVFGRDDVETLLVNDASAWSGSPLSSARPPIIAPGDAAAALEEARAAVLEQRDAEATPALQRLQHRHSQTFLPFAEIRFSSGCGDRPRSEYARRLDLATATHETRSVRGGHALRQLVWASHPHSVVVVEFAFDGPDGTALDVTVESPLRILGRSLRRGRASLRLQMPSDVAPPHDDVEDPVQWDDHPRAALRGAIAIGWRHDGVDVTPEGRVGLSARGVRRATLVISTATTFTGVGRWPNGDAVTAESSALHRVDRALAVGVATVRADHLADHRELYSRTSLNCGASRSHLPMDERLGAIDARHRLDEDPALAALLFNYGRYLLIASSRAGAPPANLQGIWNPEMRPPWSSNYTTNINLPMNYWQTEVARLPETAEPLFDLIDALTEHGAETARRLYDADGWVAHHNTDAWAYTLPVGHGTHDPIWAFWPFAGPWLVQHLAARLDYAASPAAAAAFARERAWWPVLGAARFVLSWLRDVEGTVTTVPSTSPENAFVDARGAVASAGIGSTLDLTLARDTLRLCVRIAEMLDIADEPVVERARTTAALLRPLRIGAEGTIREWQHDPRAVDPLHRHQSHLYFAYPGGDVLDREFADAVSRSLDGRGEETTGWSLAWRLGLRARLRQPDRVWSLLGMVFRDMGVDRGHLVGGVYPNLLMAHPPFQIDANLGYVAALAECLLQSHAGVIDVLPALPAGLPDGSVRGLLARGGVIVDIRWAHGELAAVGLRRDDGADGDIEVTVRHRRRTTAIVVDRHGVRLDGRLTLLRQQ